MFRSATLKLTMWYVLLIVALSLLFSGVIYHFSTDELTDALNQQYHTLNTNDHDSDNRYLPAKELDLHSKHLLSQLVYFNILVLAGSSIVSYILAERTLRPIEKAHQAQLRFTAEASHELRTPLAAIKADTEVTLMEKTSDNASMRRTLQENLKDIEKLELLANHLLNVSRAQSSGPSGAIDLELAISSTVDQFKRTIHNKQLKLRVDTVPVRIRGDEYSIKQLLTIVLDNAIKYSKKGGTITLKIYADGNSAIITVTDTGIGIPAADLPHVYERFYRSENTNSGSKNIDGHGLGLSLAQKIIESHKGSINIRSHKPSGAVVTIRLPLIKQQ